MRRAFFRSAFVVAMALSVLLPAQAQWKWRDAQGRIQYSDRPPPHSVPDKDVLARPAAQSAVAPPPAAPASAPASAALPAVRDPQLEARKRQGEADEQAQRRAEEEKVARQRKENCERAREYARTLDSGMRIARVNPQGEREVLDDEQRAAEVAKTREVVTSECR
jgi:hypothetical protein